MYDVCVLCGGQTWVHHLCRGTFEKLIVLEMRKKTSNPIDSTHAPSR
jgi:hypothetical protein